MNPNMQQRQLGGTSADYQRMTMAQIEGIGSLTRVDTFIEVRVKFNERDTFVK